MDPSAGHPGWCGRVDLVYEAYGDGLVVADWKSTKSGLYAESFLQLGAYAHSVQSATGMKVLRTELIHIDRNTGGFRVATRGSLDWEGDAEDFLMLADVRRQMQLRESAVRKVMKQPPIGADTEAVA